MSLLTVAANMGVNMIDYELYQISNKRTRVAFRFLYVG
jgi:hypothetical protein